MFHVNELFLSPSLRYVVKGLLQLVEDQLAWRLNVDNVLPSLALAWRPGSTTLLWACSQCLKGSLDQVKEKEEWKEIFGDVSDLVANLLALK